MQVDNLITTGCFRRSDHAASQGLLSPTLVQEVQEASDPRHGQMIHVAFIRMSVSCLKVCEVSDGF